MKTKIHSFLLFAESERFRGVLKWIVVASLLIYLFTSISGYASWFPGSAHYFAFNTKSGLIIRVLSSAIFLGASFFVYLSFRRSIDYKWLIVFLILLIFIFLCMLYTPTSYSVLYRTTKLYNFMAQYETSVSVATVTIMYVSFAVDILFGYSFMFVLPHIFKKNTCLLLFILIPFILIIFYSCIYSFVKERTYYINFIRGNWEYNAYTIGSIFGNKQQWGIFLAPTLPTCLITGILIYKSNLSKIIKSITYGFCAITFTFAFFCALAAFCKTAILTNIIFIIFPLVGLILWLFLNKKKIVLPLILTFLITLFVISYFVFMSTDSLHQSGIGKIVFNIIKSFFNESEIGSASRLEIVMGTLQNFPASNIFFGFSKGVLDCFVRTTVPYMNNGLHTGLAIYFGRTGIVGFTIYFILLGFVLVEIIKIVIKNYLYGFIVLGSFLSSFILNFGELEILIFSSSGAVYIVNLFSVVLPISETIKEHKDKDEK